ncbi:Endonuclease/Exonuclease/phosphatase family protein [compost metagenome]
MHHGYIYARVKNYHVVVAHLSPFSYEKCKEEISNILALCGTLPKKEKLMVMGDLNSFAATDSLLYREKGYKRRFGVVQLILDQGLTDAYCFKHKAKEFSYPTKKYENGIKQYGRLDYIFLNDAIKKDCLDIRIVKDEVTGQLSDHYPLLMELKL